MKFIRALDLWSLLQKKSFFLFGPRSIGKSFLIAQQFQEDRVVTIDLLRSDIFLRLSASPSLLEEMLKGVGRSFPKYVVIDEIQKLPVLLDEIHRLIEKYKTHFLLTGSSARKLKRGTANLLGGRAWIQNIFPLCTPELPNFNLSHYLRYGGLPPVVLSKEPREELHAYVQAYLTEEIQAEGLVRKLPNFSRFLMTAAISNGQMINYTEIGNDSQLSPSTVREFYHILEDTLIGFCLPPWTRSQKRKAIQTAKFYLFDTGVVHAITNTQSLDRHSDLYGRSFEHFIAMELRAYLDYRRNFSGLSFWRSSSNAEVDFLIGDRIAIEVKATQKVSPQHLKGLKKLQEEKIFKRYFLVTQDPIAHKHEFVECLPWDKFLKMLWNDELNVQ